MVTKIVTGTCYEDAWRFLIKQGEGHLIHGSVKLSAEGPRVSHAWVELPTGFIWEPQTKSFYTADDFKIMGPTEEHRYTVEEAAIMLARVSKHGPWSDEERRQFLKRSGNPGFTAKEAKSIGEKLGIDFKGYDVEQFRRGLNVELEHCNVTNCDPLLTGKIAQAHLNELPDYYTRLAKMEETSRMKTETERKSFHERIFGKGSTPPLERLGKGETLNNLRPMPPEEGPPLPRMLALRWPWKE